MLINGLTSDRESTFHAAYLTERPKNPLPTKPRQPPLAGKQFLHGALFDLALFGDEFIQGFNEGIGVAQGFGDGLLFSLRGRERDHNFMQIVSIDSRNTTFPAVLMEVNTSKQI